MELDSQLLQDLLEFLHTLENATLPAKIEALRVRLMGRMQTALSSSSNYMDMQFGKPLKGHIKDPADNCSEYYMISDQPPLSPSSFLYPRQDVKPNIVQTNPKCSPRKCPDQPPPPASAQLDLPPPIADAEEDKEILEEIEPLDSLLEVYNTMNFTKAQAKSHFHGQLQRREKWLFIENIRPFWAALVGWHLLSFNTKTDQKPSQILSIKGCSCKPVPFSQRNPKKLADSTFELRYGDNKTFQFIASTPKEMQQWMAAILRLEKKARDKNNVLLLHNAMSPPPPPLSEEELSSEDTDQNEEYIEVDLVIDNLAEALANPAKVLKSNPSTPSVGQPVRPPKPAASPIHPNRIVNRVLPPPPSAKRNSEQDEDVYQMIEENTHNQPSTSINSSGKIRQEELSASLEDDNNGELYDDIDNVKKEVKEIEAKNSKREIERRTPAQEPDDDDVGTYDDVIAVKMEVEEIRRKENAAKGSVEVDKEKQSPQELPTKSSPVKNFFGRFRQKNEYPQKEMGRTKPFLPSPQRPTKTSASTELPIEQNSSVAPETLKNNPILADLSDYNSPPYPRPVDGDRSFPSIGNAEEEVIYDDISNRNDVFNHGVVTKKDEIIPTKNSSPVCKEGYPTPISNTHKNVVRNLNEKFNAEIYQNQTGDSNREDDSGLYKIPRPDANAHMQSPVEDDDDNERIYDDVAIVAQKKREIKQAKEKPVVVSPPKFNRGPAVLAKPFENNFFNKLNKLTSQAAEKQSASEKNNQHRFSPGKKSKTQEAIINLKKHQITATEEQIYDDCQATKG